MYSIVAGIAGVVGAFAHMPQTSEATTITDLDTVVQLLEKLASKDSGHAVNVRHRYLADNDSVTGGRSHWIEAPERLMSSQEALSFVRGLGRRLEGSPAFYTGRIQRVIAGCAAVRIELGIGYYTALKEGCAPLANPQSALTERVTLQYTTP